MSAKMARTPSLEIAYLDSGPAEGQPVILLHGFPYDAHAYDEVAPILAAAGHRVIVPWLRGFGATRFRDAATLRSGQQAALGRDVVDLMDALAIPCAVLAGYDWGACAACVAAALRPDRVSGLVSTAGYHIQDIAAAAKPKPPQAELLLWYQYYLHGERGRAGLAGDRDAFCALLWRLWSPDWQFDDATFARTAAAFQNPDFVDVVIHSYRHRFGLVAGDPQLAADEARLAELPSIDTAMIVPHGARDGVESSDGAVVKCHRFTGRYTRRLLPGIGHNVPQEAPAAFAAAVMELARAH